MCCRDRIKIVISTPTGSSLCGWFCWRWACSLLLSVPSQPLWVSCQIASCWLPLQVLKVDRSYAIFQGGSVAWLRFGLIYVGCPDLKDGETPLNLTIERWLPKVFFYQTEGQAFSKIDLHMSFSESGFLKNHPSKSTPSLLYYFQIFRTLGPHGKRRWDMWHVPVFFWCVSKTNGYTCVCFVVVIWMSWSYKENVETPLTTNKNPSKKSTWRELRFSSRLTS